MRKALTILFAVLLSCTFVSCSSGNPEPPADNRTQLEKADEAISSVSHVFNGVAAEKDDKGNDVVYKIENPVQINGMTVNGGTKTVSEDGFNTSVEIDISYEENGQNVSIKSSETTDISVIVDGSDANVSLEETNNMLAKAKQIPASVFTETAGENGTVVYTYEAISSEPAVKRILADENTNTNEIKKVVITFTYESNKASYEYAVTYNRDGGNCIISESSSKQVDMKRGSSEVNISADLRNEFSLSNVQATDDVYYIVNFEIDGNSGETFSQRVKEGNTASVPVLSAPDEDTFLNGWYTDKSLTDRYNFSVPVEENITLYAKRIPYEDVELTMWSMWNAEEPQAQIIQKAAETFEKETGAVVNIEFRGRDIATTISTALQNGEHIDIFEEDYTRIGQQYAAYCYDMSAMAEASGYFGNSYPLFNNMTKEWTGGKLVSVAEQPNMGGIFYDKAKFEAAGITETPTTWAEFLDVCQKLVDAGYQPLALDGTYADFNFGYHLDRYIGEAKTRELSLNGGWSNEPGVIAAAEDIIDFVNRCYLAEGAPDEYPTSQNKIGFENVAMIVCADYVTSEVNNNTGAGIEWGVFNYPSVPVEDGGNGSRNVYAGANSFAITAQCAAPKVAYDFLMTLVTGDFDQERAELIPQIPADPSNQCTALDGAVDTLMEAEEALSWTMGINANSDLKAELKNTIIELFRGNFKTGEEFAAALDALY